MPSLKQTVLDQMAHECRHTLQTARLDLDAFLALDAQQRAARWSQWDLATKRTAVAMMQLRKYGDVYVDLIDETIAHYDAKWQPPTPAAQVPDAAVAAELARLAEEHAGYARTARAAKLKDDATFFQRAANAYVRALEAWNAGIRPWSLGPGKWLLPSRSDGPSHLLRLDGDWRCTCAAGDSAHWAKALIIGIEQASEDMDRFDDPVEPAPAPTPAAQLGQRLAEARANHMAIAYAV